ncbi:lipid-binding SYLF domain-containing protein [Photobacterium toruni]|uniref:lipid-binding SYLF domain-containing protein n=1 Tax=Photobacterium toruni TaxID=1935446 RepID=UPI002E178319|nr:lipid-binding SYLF domain-containing protein [Photobacterium toruni]
MKATHKIFTTLCSLLILMLSTQVFAQEQQNDTKDALAHFYNSPQTQPFFHSAYGYAVFPSVGKGGFWIGGAYGSGVVFKANQAMGFAKLYQISIGLQFGGQAFSEILFFQDKRAYNRFIDGGMELDAQASAVALTEGASAKIGTAGAGINAGNDYMTQSYINGVAIFTHAKGGAMIEASLAGQKFTYEPMTTTTRKIKGYDQVLPEFNADYQPTKQTQTTRQHQQQLQKPADTITSTDSANSAVVVDTIERPDY